MELLSYIDMHFLLGLTLILGVFCVFYYSSARKQSQAMVKLDLLVKQLEGIHSQVGVLINEQRSCNRLFSDMSPQMAFMPQEDGYAASETYASMSSDITEPSLPSNKLYVGNIDYSATESELEKHFLQHGQIEFVNIPVNRYTGRARGFGFVTFVSRQDAERAMGLHGSEFKGRQIQVNFAKDRDTVS